MKDNEIIAEFMNVKEIEGSFISYGHDAPCWFTTNGLLRSSTFTVPNKSFSEFVHESKYHTSWDWLMPVVSRISHLAVTSKLPYPAFKTVTHTTVNADISTLYKRVVEFIKWYNSQQK